MYRALICEYGNGLLGSHIEWEDIEKELQKKYGRKTKMGENKKISPIGIGIGLQSLIGCVEPDWSFPAFNLPEKFVIKIASPLGLFADKKEDLSIETKAALDRLNLNFIEFLKPCHNTEIQFFELLSKLNPRPAYLPYMYCGRIFNDENQLKAFQLLEYLDSHDVILPTENMSKKQIDQVLSAWSSVIVSFLDIKEEDKKKMPFQGLSQVYKNMDDWVIRFYNSIISQFPHPRLQELSAEFEKIIPDIISAEEIDRLPDKMGFEQVIVHGDLWTNNIMWKKRDHKKLAHIVDFQMSHFGLFITDFTRLLNTATTSFERRNNWKNYLETFYKALLENLNGRSAPFSIEQLETLYEVVYPRISSYLIAPLFTILQNVVEREDSVEKIRAIDILLEKIIAIYEDIILYHQQRNAVSV